jgi:competence protein ComEC
MRYPFLYLFVAFVVGIIFRINDLWQVNIWTIFAIPFIVSGFIYVKKFLPIYPFYWREMLTGSLFLLFIPIGVYRTDQALQLPANDIAPFTGQYLQFKGHWISESPFHEFGRRAWLETDSVYDGVNSYAVSGKIQVKIHNDDRTFYRAGDVVQFKGRLEPLKTGKNEGYYQYLLRNGIRFQVKAVNIKRIGRIVGLNGWLLDVRQRWEELFYEKIHAEAEAGLAVALILGERSYLSQDLKKAYLQTGLTHLIALSGSHIAVLLLVMNWFWMLSSFVPIPRWVRAVLMILLLLGYMLLSGASASVVRAVLMGCLYLVGQLFFLQRNTLNLLFVAGFLQVVYDPLIIQDIGFQLSYLAVLGIITVWLPIRWLLVQILRRKKLRDWLRNMLLTVADAVGICLVATLFTLPAVLFHFSMLADYFLPANLLASLPVSVATVLGFLLLMVGKIPLIGEVVGLLLTYALKGMNAVAFYFSSFPEPTTEIGLALGQMVGIYVALIGITFGIRWSIRHAFQNV